MDAFLRLPDDERRIYCEQAQARLALPPASVEKDFWVCWTLRELFGHPEWGTSLTFKGGTSLSKGFGLIKRFSEDVDIVIDRACLGFGDQNDPASASSNKQRRKRIDALKDTCRNRIQRDLYPALNATFAAQLPEAPAWSLSLDPADKDGQTILFGYPSVLDYPAAYVRPVVRIELGARSDTWPAENVHIRPYLSEAFPERFDASGFSVKALSAERTFWEKAMLVHEESYRPAGSIQKPRLARHYYDLWCLIEHGIAERAMDNPVLFTSVADHRKIYFHHNWFDYESLKQGTLRLEPVADRLQEWRSDYEKMGEMIFGEMPSFDTVLESVLEFESRFNSGGRASEKAR